MKLNNRIFIFSMLALLIVIAMTDILSQPAFDFLTATSEKALLSLGIIADLKLAAGAGSSVNLPLISGTLKSASQLLDEAFTHLEWANLMLAGQMLLLTLSKSWLLKVLLFISVAGAVLLKTGQRFMIKLLLVFLLLNPGLPLYVLGVKYIAQESEIQLGEDLHTELNLLKSQYNEEKSATQKKLDALKQKQLAKRKAKGKENLSWLSRLEDNVLEKGSEAKSKISYVSHEALAILKDGSQQIIANTISMLGQIIFLFVLLPFGYFYLLKSMVKEYQPTSQDLELSAQFRETVTTQFNTIRKNPKTILNKSNLWLLAGCTGIALIVYMMVQSGSPDSTAASEPESKNSALPVSEKKTEQSPEKYASTEKPTEVKGPVLGIDVSHFQGEVEWKKIRKAGITFTYAKATQGENYHDPKFPANWKGAQKAGLYRGAYHFYMVGQDPVQQALSFINRIGTLEKGDLPPMLDLEQACIPKGHRMETEVFQQNVKKWLDQVEKELGMRPIIYTNRPFANDYLDHPDFSRYKLWMAEYGVRKPRLPKTWSKAGWTIWQRSPKGAVEGEVGNVDHDILNGSLENLQKLAKQ